MNSYHYVKCEDTVIGSHIKELWGLCSISDKAFIKFYKQYMGEDIDRPWVFQCRVYLIHMVAKNLVKDCEVLMNDWKEDEDKED